jgi:hypothetical protein
MLDMSRAIKSKSARMTRLCSGWVQLYVPIVLIGDNDAQVRAPLHAANGACGNGMPQEMKSTLVVNLLNDNLNGDRTMKYRLVWASLAVFVMFAASAAASSYCGPFAWAGNGCQRACDKAFAQCYKTSGGDRRACAEARARCLNNCLGY